MVWRGKRAQALAAGLTPPPSSTPRPPRASCPTVSPQLECGASPTPSPPPPSCRVRWRPQLWLAGQVSTPMFPTALCRVQRWAAVGSAAAGMSAEVVPQPLHGRSRATVTQVDSHYFATLAQLWRLLSLKFLSGPKTRASNVLVTLFCCCGILRLPFLILLSREKNKIRNFRTTLFGQGNPSFWFSISPFHTCTDTLNRGHWSFSNVTRRPLCDGCVAVCRLSPCSSHVCCTLFYLAQF